MHLVDPLVRVPMSAKPCLVFDGFLDGIEPLLGAVINGTLIDTAEKHLPGFVLVRAGVGQDNIKRLVLYLLFNIRFDLSRGLLIGPPAPPLA